MNPCDNCKKKPNCPDRCFPKMDYERGQKKRGRNGKHDMIHAKMEFCGMLDDAPVIVPAEGGTDNV